MKVVGVGCGDGMLTEEAVAVLQGARLIYGSSRAIERVRHHINPDCTVRTITDYKTIQSMPDEAVILSTGDPLLAGLGYPGCEIICGISSLQAAFAAVGIPWSNVSVIDAHGKDHAEAIGDAATDCRRARPVFIIADPKFPVHELAEALRGMDLILYICQDLGEPEERIITGTPENPPVPDSKLFCCIVSPNRME